MTMTNTPILIPSTPTPRYARRIPLASDFKPLDRTPDTSRNFGRGTPPRRKVRTIL